VRHSALREGAQLGLIVATSVWVWVALVDLIVGEPFHTFAVLGGIVTFTVLHYLLHSGTARGRVGHPRVAREPRLASPWRSLRRRRIALALITVLLSQMGSGRSPGCGSSAEVVGVAVAFRLLSGPRLGAALRKAEQQEEADE